MAYIKFHKEFWSDDYILKLNKDQKLVYTYLITNEKTRQCGIYELPISKATFELGISSEEFILYLKKFHDDKKIQYNMNTQEICVINWIKHNENTSWQTYEKVKKELTEVKDLSLMLILYDPRKPLFDGTRKKDGVQVTHIIENPWKVRFISLSDEMLHNIRLPFDKTQDSSSFLCPIDAPLMPHHTGACTNTLHNTTYTNTLHNQNTNAVIHKPVYENVPDYEPPQVKLSNLITEAINHWNTKENLPPCRYTVITLPNNKLSDITNMFDVHRDGQILQAIDNLSKAYDSLDQKYRPKNFQNFIVNSLDNWFEERVVEPVKRDYRTMEERMYFDSVVTNKDAPDEWKEEMKQKCIQSLRAIDKEFIDYECS